MNKVTGRLVVNLETAHKDALTEYAEAKGTTMSFVIRELVAGWYSRSRKTPAKGRPNSGRTETSKR